MPKEAVVRVLPEDESCGNEVPCMCLSGQACDYSRIQLRDLEMGGFLRHKPIKVVSRTIPVIGWFSGYYSAGARNARKLRKCIEEERPLHVLYGGYLAEGDVGSDSYVEWNLSFYLRTGRARLA